MKKLFRKLFLFVAIPYIFLVFPVDIWLWNVNSIYKEKITGLDKSKEQVELLVLGNSRASLGIDPTEFSFYTFNLANANQSLYFDIRQTKLFIEKMTKLKYVFISVGYHSLYFSNQGSRNYRSYYANGIKHPDGNYILATISPFLVGYKPATVKLMAKRRWKNIQQYGYKESIDFFTWRGVNPLDTVFRGYFGIEQSVDRMFKDQKYQKRAEILTEVISSSNEHNEVLLELESFIIELQKRGITPILITNPTYLGFNKYLDSNTIDQNQIEIEELTQKYNIEYWNYVNDTTFKKEHFHDCDHMNKKGARTYSKMLEKNLMKLDSSLQQNN